MPRFHYNGLLFDGSRIEGVASARNGSELEAKLIGRGIFVEQVKPSLGKAQQAYLCYLKRQEITRITRQIGILLKSEIPMLEVMRLVGDQLRDDRLRQVLERITTDIEGGRSVAAAFGEYPGIFDDLYVSMITAGESSGLLGDAFERVATYREKHEAVSRKIRSALAYPALVTLVSVVVVLVLVLHVVPVFASLYENFGAELPALTSKIVQVSTVLRETFWLWLMAMPVAIAVLVWLGLTAGVRAAVDKTLLKLPVVRRLATKIVSARFCRTMGSLLTSGVDILCALRIASKTTGNRFAVKRLRAAEADLEQGKSFTEAISAAGIFPKPVLRLAESGERTGRLGDLLSRAADYYENETDSDMATITTLIEPVVIILLGGLVALILAGMYLPLFELAGGGAVSFR